VRLPEAGAEPALQAAPGAHVVSPLAAAELLRTLIEQVIVAEPAEAITE
jgi:hypothetical protein